MCKPMADRVFPRLIRGPWWWRLIVEPESELHSYFATDLGQAHDVPVFQGIGPAPFEDLVIEKGAVPAPIVLYHEAIVFWAVDDLGVFASCDIVVSDDSYARGDRTRAYRRSADESRASAQWNLLPHLVALDSSGDKLLYS